MNLHRKGKIVVQSLFCYAKKKGAVLVQRYFNRGGVLHAVDVVC